MGSRKQFLFRQYQKCAAQDWDVPFNLWLKNCWHGIIPFPFDISWNGDMEIFWCALKNFLFVRLRKELPTYLFTNWTHNSKHNNLALTFLQSSCLLEPFSRTSGWGGSLVLGFFTLVSQGLIWAVRTFPAESNLGPDVMVDFQTAECAWVYVRTWAQEDKAMLPHSMAGSWDVSGHGA